MLGRIYAKDVEPGRRVRLMEGGRWLTLTVTATRRASLLGDPDGFTVLVNEEGPDVWRRDGAIVRVL